MTRRRIVIIGGGLAGLSTGCYALANGWDAHIVEHHTALGGVCTAWQRGPYTIDGCIHWLTGGPFSRLYEELHIAPPVELRPLEQFASYRHTGEGWSLTIDRDLELLRRDLHVLAPEDRAEVDRLIAAAATVPRLDPGIEHPPELTGLRSQMARILDLWGQAGTLMHFRGSVEQWTDGHLHHPGVRRWFCRWMPPGAPMLFALMVMGYLARGWLSRPKGGTGPFRDALVDRFRALGGQAQMGATVKEVIVHNDHARGVRLADETVIEGDLVVSTASMPETVLILLSGRYGADTLRRQLFRFRPFDPIVLMSLGVARSLDDVPPMLILDGLEPAEVAGRWGESLYVRTYNDDPSFAPAGHTVVQLMLVSDFDWWQGHMADLAATKASVADHALARLEPHLPGLTDAVRMIDLATPLTFWQHARSWRGAYEGWQPSTRTFSPHVPKTLTGLGDFYMAGQWVEPGGGVPMALMSGRQLVQILCERERRAFTAEAA